MSNDLQGSTITELETLTGEHTIQIETNTGAITTLTGQTETSPGFGNVGTETA